MDNVLFFLLAALILLWRWFLFWDNAFWNHPYTTKYCKKSIYNNLLLITCFETWGKLPLSTLQYVPNVDTCVNAKKTDFATLNYASKTRLPNPGGGDVLREKLGGGVRPASHNAYPIYDRNVRFFLPYWWPDQKFDVLFMTVAAGTVVLNITYEGLWLMILSVMMKR